MWVFCFTSPPCKRIDTLGHRLWGQRYRSQQPRPTGQGPVMARLREGAGLGQDHGLNASLRLPPVVSTVSRTNESHSASSPGSLYGLNGLDELVITGRALKRST